MHTVYVARRRGGGGGSNNSKTISFRAIAPSTIYQHQTPNGVATAAKQETLLRKRPATVRQSVGNRRLSRQHTRTFSHILDSHTRQNNSQRAFFGGSYNPRRRRRRVSSRGSFHFLCARTKQDLGKRRRMKRERALTPSHFFGHGNSFHSPLTAAAATGGGSKKSWIPLWTQQGGKGESLEGSLTQ